MSIRARKLGQDTDQAQTFSDAAALRAAMAEGTLGGQDEYFVPAEDAWAPLDEHPDFSTTDARGAYPAIVHAVVFLKILVFIAFLSLLDGHPEALLHPGAFYVYGILIGDALAISLAYLNQNKAAAALFWILGLGSMPLGLFLIVAAGLTRNFRYRAAE